MIHHKFCNSFSSPFWMSEDERNVCFDVSGIRYEECKTNNYFAINRDATEVGILQAFGHYLEIIRKKDFVM